MAEQVYKQIRDHIRSLVKSRQLLPGQSLPSERTLGQEFHASQYPVRHALDELIAEGILHRIPGKGTFVKPSGGRSVKTNRIGVVYSFPDHDFIASPFYAAILGGINRQAQQEERMLLLRSFKMDGTTDPRAVIKELDQDVDGYIVVDPVYPHISMLERAAAASVKPFVALNYERTIANTDQINFDAREGTAGLVRFLYEAGHRNIGFAYYSTEFFGGMKNPNLANRLAGYRECMRECGLPDDRWAVRQESIADTASLRALLGRPDRPTVIMAAHDMHAVRLYAQLRDAGFRIPDDVAVVGYDGTPEGGHLYPALTTVDTPLREMGMAAVKRLLEREKESDPGMYAKTVLPSRIKVRESHKPLTA